MTDLPGVRWNNLFDDLESQLAQELSAEDLDLRIEEERLRLGRLGLRDRLVALVGNPAVTLVIADGSRRSMHIVTVGKDWLAGDLLDSTSRRSQCIMPLAAIAGLDLTAIQVASSLEQGHEEPGLSVRLGLSFALRDLCRRRRAVGLILSYCSLHGTIDRVGRDHFDFAIHDRDVPRRESAVTAMRVVPFSELRLIRF